MNILLTGGAGYIGSHVILAILENGHNVTVIDDLSTGHQKLIPSNIKLINCNINNKEKLSNLLKLEKFDVLMHFAGSIKVEESVNNPEKYFFNNTNNSIALFETCYENGLRNIIFSSTAAVYGNPSNQKSIVEEEILKPLNPYGESKLKTENFLINNQDKFQYTILRYFNVAGADQKLRTGLISKEPTHLIKILSEVVVGKKEKIFIFGNDYNTKDGTAVRDYIHVSDLANIHLEVAKYLITIKKSNIFNCGYGRGYSVKEVIDEGNKLTGNKIRFEYANRRIGDAEELVSNIEKISKHINYKPKFNDLSLIIESSLSWEKKLYEQNL